MNHEFLNGVFWGLVVYMYVDTGYEVWLRCRAVDRASYYHRLLTNVTQGKHTRKYQHLTNGFFALFWPFFAVLKAVLWLASGTFRQWVRQGRRKTEAEPETKTETNKDA